MRRHWVSRSRYSLDQKGMVLILTFIIMTTLTAITIAYLYMISVKTKGSGYDIVGTQAFWLAEAGLQEAFYRLKNDADFRANPSTINTALGKGSYSVEVSKNGSIYTVTATGTVKDLSKRIIQSAVVSGGTPEAFSHCLYADNNKIRFQNVKDAAINGDITARRQIQSVGNVDVSGEVSPWTAVSFPTVDFAYFESVADQVVNGNKTFLQGRTYSGIWYVKGNATLRNGVTLNGTIISDKNINLANSGDIKINPASGYPALVAKRNVNARRLEDSTVNGLVFAEWNVRLQYSKDNTFSSTLLAGRNLTFQNSEDWTINYDAGLQDGLEGFSDVGSNVLVTVQKDWDEVAPGL